MQPPNAQLNISFRRQVWAPLILTSTLQESMQLRSSLDNWFFLAQVQKQFKVMV